MVARPETEAERLRRLQLWETWIKSVGDTAREAWDSGRAFHVVKLNLGGSTAGFMSMVESEGDDAAGALQTIESVGWRLDDVGYVYQPLKERSHALTDSAHMTGNIVGIYTFRRPPEPSQPPP
jgi:hypothetical protein